MTVIEFERIAIRSLPLTEGIPLGFWEGRVKEVSHPELKNIFVLPTREEAARFAAEKILELVAEKPDAAISWPSGYQGNDVIDQVVKLSKERGISFDRVHCFHLDEYFPIDPEQPESFRKNLRERFFTPLAIPTDHIHEIPANPGSNGETVARDYEALLNQFEIDLVLHPIGPDGHMAFDEVGTPRDSLTHLVKLSDKTVYRDRVERKLNSPDSAITQGIGTILRAKHILFINFSPSYQKDMKQALFGPIGEHNPSSFLRTQGHKVDVVMPQEIANHVLA